MVYVITMISAELKRWREVNGYTQSKLAKALGVASMTVTRWEMGIRSIPPFLHLALMSLKGRDTTDTDGHKKKKGKESKRHG
jgi:transcriptional regulator with XRE-family HTH domain